MTDTNISQLESEENAISMLEALVAKWDSEPFPAIGHDASWERRVIRECLTLARNLRNAIPEQTTDTTLEREIISWLDSLPDAVRICEGGGPENLAASFAVNVSRLATASKKDAEPERMAPVQGYSAGIPWSMHLEAYDAYCKMYSPQPALIQDGCRGGFGIRELDQFIPGWRERLSERTAMKEEIANLREQLEVATQPKNQNSDVTIMDLHAKWKRLDYFERFHGLVDFDVGGKILRLTYEEAVIIDGILTRLSADLSTLATPS